MRNFKYLFLVAGFLLLAAYGNELLAQCPMCKIAAESNLKNGGTQGKGLNLGILYMLATPYLLIGTIGFLWWRNRKREKQERNEMPFDAN